MCGEAEGYYVEENGFRKISCMFDRDGILYAECGVMGCYHVYRISDYEFKLCVHQLAFLFLIEEYLEKYNPGDTTDLDGIELLGGFRAKKGLKFLEEEGEEIFDLRLEPVLEKEYGDLSFSIKVGIDKVYVVKNLTEFIEAYDGKGSMKFSTKTEIDFFRHRIRAEDEEALAYIRHIVKEEQEHNIQYKKSYYYHYGEEIKQKVALYGSRLDRFYDLYKGSQISCTEKIGGRNVKTAYLFQDGKPKISLKIEKDMDEDQIFHGIQVKGRIPAFTRGEQYHYYFTKESFSRISEEVADNLEPLLELERNGSICFSVGRKKFIRILSSGITHS